MLVHKKGLIALKPAHTWATAGLGTRSASWGLLPPLCSHLDGLLCCIEAFQVCFIPLQSNSGLSHGVSPKRAAPAPLARAQDIEVCLLTALPLNVPLAVSRDAVYPAPAKCGKGVTNGFKTEYLDQKMLKVHYQVYSGVIRRQRLRWWLQDLFQPCS